MLPQGPSLGRWHSLLPLSLPAPRISRAHPADPPSCVSLGPICCYCLPGPGTALTAPLAFVCPLSLQSDPCRTDQTVPSWCHRFQQLPLLLGSKAKFSWPPSSKLTASTVLVPPALAHQALSTLASDAFPGHAVLLPQGLCTGHLLPPRAPSTTFSLNQHPSILCFLGHVSRHPG